MYIINMNTPVHINSICTYVCMYVCVYMNECEFDYKFGY